MSEDINILTSKRALSLLNYSGIKKVPSILQSEVSECGLACLAMVSSYYGYHVNLTHLRKSINFDNHGITLKDLMILANKSHFSTRALQCNLGEVAKLKLPCILHWELDHYVVLTKISKRSVLINDPAFGKRKLTIEQFSKGYTGIALELLPTTSFKKKNIKEVMSISFFWEKIIGLKRSLFSLFLLSILMQLVAIFSPYYIQLVLDKVIPNYDKSLLALVAIGFSLLILVKIIIEVLRSWLILLFSTSINIQMGSNLFYHLIRLPIDFFEKRHVGDIVSKFSSLSSIRELLTTGLVEALIDGVMSLSLIIMMYLYSPNLTYIVMLVVLLSTIVKLVFYFPNRRITEETIVADAKEDSFFLESIRAIQTIKLFSHETARQNNWLNRYADVINTDIRLNKLSIYEEAINDLLFGIETIIVVYCGAVAVINEQLTIGMLLAFLAYKNQFISSITGLVSNLISFKLLGLHLERLSDITLQSKEDFLPKPITCTADKGSLKVENLSFRYSDNSDWIIQNLSFEVYSGECVVVSGYSGAGKTTLMKLLLGLLKPCSGNIYLNGRNVDEFSADEYRKFFGSVMQNDTLLSGTLGENISMFDTNYDEVKLTKSCKSASIWHEISALPMQLNTLVGDMGNVFSGGQLQRIFLARALYKEPEILCLDESTSHLDSCNEERINNYVRKLNITRIIISHREDVIQSADKVIRI